MSEPFLGEIRILPYSFAPRGWAQCDGQLVAISQNTALFSLLGTYYGGDGRTNFALPDFRSSVPLHFGQGPGLTDYVLGGTGGSETVTLLTTQLPAHNHAAKAEPGGGNNKAPNGRYWAGSSRRDLGYAASSNVQMAADILAPMGGGQPHNNVQPYLALNICIALQGVYPPRS